MKRLIVFVMAALATLAAGAQTLTDEPDSTADGRSWSVNVGLSAGATLYGGGNDLTPYFSRYGFIVQVPLMVHFDMSPKWRLSTGLRYDFNWDPLYYEVVLRENSAGEEFLAINTHEEIFSQHVTMFHSYLGIPLRLTWYPNANDHQVFSLSLDCYAAYAVNQHFSIQDQRISSSVVYDENAPQTYYSLHTEYEKGAVPSMLPWKLEVGFSISTDFLGLIHGIRIFGNLLPQYKDVVKGKKIRTVGVTVFL